MFLGPGSCYYSGSLDHCFSFVELHCKKSKKINLSLPYLCLQHPRGSSNPPLLPPRVSQATKVFDLLGVNLSQLALCRGSAWPSFCPAGSPLCWGATEVWKEFFFLQERGSLLIWLLRDSTGVQTSRQSGHRYRWRRGRGRVTAVSGFLCLYGEGVRGQMERLEENISDISSGWLMGSHSCRQATWAVLLCILWVIYANILTFDLYISLGKYDSQLWFFKSRITIFFLLSNWSLKISGMNPICAKSPLNSG